MVGPGPRLSQSHFLSHDMERFAIVTGAREGGFVTGPENPKHAPASAKPKAPSIPRSGSASPEVCRRLSPPPQPLSLGVGWEVPG